MDKNIPLSELIRIGCKVTKPMTRAYYAKGADGTVYACAIGAAIVAVQGTTDIRQDQVTKLLFIGADDKVTHPMTGDLRRVESVVVSLVDDHGWSREKVADWLEAIGR